MKRLALSLTRRCHSRSAAAARRPRRRVPLDAVTAASAEDIRGGGEHSPER